jgi:hypothetical protein
MPSNAYVLGGETFTAKAHAEQRARSILHGGPVPRCLTGNEAAFVADLLALHARATEKIGPGIRGLWVKGNLYGAAGFFIERVDGTWMDFSYKKCLTPQTIRTQALQAMRRAIAEQVHAFKVSAYTEGSVALRLVRCAISGELLPWEDAHVDHAYPDTFVALVDAFLAGRRETVDHVSVAPHPSGQGVILGDAGWALAWQAYHRERAVLRIVKARINIERGARA